MILKNAQFKLVNGTNLILGKNYFLLLKKAANPYDVFALFIDDAIIYLLVLETNKYAEQKLNISELPPSSQMHKWKQTNSEKMKKFLGLILWMGFVRANPISNYCSKSIS